MSSRGGFADGPSSRLLAAVAARSAAASRIELGSADALLRSIVEAASSLFDSEAASIALHDPATGRLRFVVAAGAQVPAFIGTSPASIDASPDTHAAAGTSCLAGHGFPDAAGTKQPFDRG